MSVFNLTFSVSISRVADCSILHSHTYIFPEKLSLTNNLKKIKLKGAKFPPDSRKSGTFPSSSSSQSDIFKTSSSEGFEGGFLGGNLLWGELTAAPRCSSQSRLRSSQGRCSITTTAKKREKNSTATKFDATTNGVSCLVFHNKSLIRSI